MLLSKGIEKFIESREVICEISTVTHYKNSIKYFMEFVTSTMDSIPELETITDNILNDFVKYLRKKPKNQNHPFIPSTNENIKNKTIKTYCLDVVSMFNWFYEKHFIQDKITDGFVMPQEENTSVVPLSVEEVKAIDDCFNLTTKYGCRNLAIIHGLLDQGMRLKEVCNLRISDIDFVVGYIIVRGIRQRKDRVIPLSGVFESYISEFLNTHRGEASDDYVFHNLDGRQLSTDSVKGIFRRLQKKDGLERVCAQLLRHTFAISFLCSGGSLAMCQFYMGHADISSTQKYVHLINDYKSNIYVLDKVFF